MLRGASGRASWPKPEHLCFSAQARRTVSGRSPRCSKARGARAPSVAASRTAPCAWTSAAPRVARSSSAAPTPSAASASPRMQRGRCGTPEGTRGWARSQGWLGSEALLWRRSPGRSGSSQVSTGGRSILSPCTSLPLVGASQPAALVPALQRAAHGGRGGGVGPRQGDGGRERRRGRRGPGEGLPARV